MIIKLKESIHDELIVIGCKPGDEIKVEAISGKTGAVYFTKYREVTEHKCVVYPEDYEVIKP